MNDHREDFTEESYRDLLIAAAGRRRFAGFQEAHAETAIALWRHDVDCSPQRALALARIESGVGVQSTFFFMLTSEFYNVLEPANAGIVRSIASMGHWIGIHFDPAAHAAAMDGAFDLAERLEADAHCFRRVLGVEPVAFSFHNPDVGDWLKLEEERVNGLVNAYSARLKRDFEYCSDSNGYWRFKRLADVVASEPLRPLQVLTHPEWWTPEVLSPRDRIGRCAEGRCLGALRRYDDFLTANGRINVR